MRTAYDLRHISERLAWATIAGVSLRAGSERVIQIGGVVAWAMVGVETFTSVAAELDSLWLTRLPPELPAADAPRVLGLMTALLWLVVLAAFLTFILLFVATTRRVQGARPSRRAIALLVGQTALALTISSDLLFLVAAAVPFVLAGRRAVAWIGAQSVVSVGAAVIEAGSEGFEPLPGLGHLPIPAIVALTVLSFLAWQTLAFCAGYVAATEVRGRRELERVNADLAATGELLGTSARLAERLHIARELHDALGHHLAGLSLNLELAGRLAEGRAAVAVQQARMMTGALLGEVREVVSTLRGDRCVDLRRALERLAAGVSEPRLQLSLSDDLTLAPPVAHVLFRVAQEALTNAVRHAAARTVRLDARRSDGWARLTVRDDGKGVAAIAPGNGLGGMRERLEQLGGRLELESAPGEGFSVDAWVPSAGEDR